MRNIKRILCGIAAAAMAVTSQNLVFAKAKNYAMIEFGYGEPVLTNIAKWMPVGATNAKMKATYAGGDWGYSTDRGNKLGLGGNYGVLIDIDDSFMKNVEPGQKVKLTIDYWDGVHPSMPGDYAEGDELYARIRTHYDSNGTGDRIPQDGDGITHLTEDIKVRNRGIWNRAEFILDDFKAGNGILNSWDLEVTDWGGQINLARNVIYKSIKVEPVAVTDEDALALTDRISLGVPGNIESMEKDQFSLSIPMQNTSKKKISVDWSFDVYNENNNLIDTFGYTCTLAAGEKRTDTKAFQNPKRYGVYSIAATASVRIGDQAYTKSFGSENFSVMVYNSDRNDDLGVNVHVIGGGLGGTKPVIESIQNAGIGWVREASHQSLTYQESTNTWTMNQKQLEDLKYISESGIKVLLQIWGPRSVYYDGNSDIPLTDSDLIKFKSWCEAIVAATHEYVDVYEVFNEPSTTMFASDFTGNQGEAYTKALKIAYDAVKAVDPSIPVAGLVSSDWESNFIRQAYAAGAYNYMDIFTGHKYPFQGTLYSQELLTKSGKEPLVSLTREYTDKEYDGYWATEYGLNSYNRLVEGEHTGKSAAPWGDEVWNTTFKMGYEHFMPRRAQARGLVLGYAVTQGMENSFDKLFVHNVIDFSDQTEYEHNWGLLNSYTGMNGYTPYSAKQGLVATAAYNHFIDDTSVVAGFLNEDLPRKNEWNKLMAFWFDNSGNPEFDRDVIMVQSEIKESAYATLSLGCPELEVYDMYANLLGTMRSENGIYSLNVSHEPYYLVGDFSELSYQGVATETRSDGKVYTVLPIRETTCEDCVPDSTSSFSLSNLSAGDQVIADGLEISSISGNVVTLKVPHLYTERAYGHIKVLDETGTLKFYTTVELRMQIPELFVSVGRDEITVSSMAETGGNDSAVLATDSEENIIGIGQKRAKESGIIEYTMEIPDIASRSCNLRLYNGTSIFSQQLLPGFEYAYTCYLNGTPVSFYQLTAADLSAQDQLMIRLKLTNRTGAENPKLMLAGAFYDENGRLISAYADRTDGWENGQETLTFTMTATENMKQMKFFVWDQNQRPQRSTLY